MNYSSLTKDDLKDHLFSLMDQVIHHLAAEPDVDKFLDQTDIFEDWEKVLPEEEYPIFVMAVLNNIRRDEIIETILHAIVKGPKPSVKPTTKETGLPDKMSDHGKHPFS